MALGLDAHPYARQGRLARGGLLARPRGARLVVAHRLHRDRQRQRGRPLPRLRRADLPAAAPGRRLPARPLAPGPLGQADRLAGRGLDRPQQRPVHAAPGLPDHRVLLQLRADRARGRPARGHRLVVRDRPPPLPGAHQLRPSRRDRGHGPHLNHRHEAPAPAPFPVSGPGPRRFHHRSRPIIMARHPPKCWQGPCGCSIVGARRAHDPVSTPDTWG
ncbi:hypothetical protein SGPA1_20451 [Streptomyces misionensis JCM 4497]